MVLPRHRVLELQHGLQYWGSLIMAMMSPGWDPMQWAPGGPASIHLYLRAGGLLWLQQFAMLAVVESAFRSLLSSILGVGIALGWGILAEILHS